MLPIWVRLTVGAVVSDEGEAVLVLAVGVGELLELELELDDELLDELELEAGIE
jgi:hypothetical protein